MPETFGVREVLLLLAALLAALATFGVTAHPRFNLLAGAVTLLCLALVFG
jgi:hypothetical protein